jgi:hypothetical protein
MRVLFNWVLLGVITILYSLKHKERFQHLINLFLFREKFITSVVEDSIKRSCEDNSSFKNQWDNNQEWRNQRRQEFNEQFSKSANELKNHIGQALLTVIKTLGFIWLTFCVITDSFFVPSGIPVYLQIVSALFILWAVIGKLGYPIQTIGGKSLPETIDNFWFIFLNVIGAMLLFSSQFSFNIDSARHVSSIQTADLYGFIQLRPWGYRMALLLLVVLFASLLIRLIIFKIKQRWAPKDIPEDNIIMYLGYLELLSYSISFSIRKPEFIAIWLGVKSLNRWREKTNNKEINIFLFGNLLNVFAAFAIAVIFYKLGLHLDVFPL